jgi:hypothetical protein
MIVDPDCTAALGYRSEYAEVAPQRSGFGIPHGVI